DSSVGVKLRTYAEYKIRGAILDSLREMDWAPRRQRRRARQLQEATAAVEQRTQRTATAAEVATELGITVEECQDWMADARTLNVGQLETSSVDDDGRDMMRQIADTSDNLPSREIERSALQKVLAQSLERMPLPERTVL